MKGGVIMPTLKIILIVFMGLFAQSVFSQNNDDGLDEVCGLSSGKWHKSASGWACCWSNWGCYGCTGGNCGMTCRTTRCKNANGMSISKVSTKNTVVKGLAPQGMKDPIVPRFENKNLPSESSDSREVVQ